MSDKLEALKAAALAATPGPWHRSGVMFNGITSEQTFMTQGNKPHIANAGEKRDAIFIAAASPDVVLSLLAALEEARTGCIEVPSTVIGARERDELRRRAEAAEQREGHLKADAAVMGKRIAELEQNKLPIIPEQGSIEVNDAAWKLHDTLTEYGPLNGHQFNNLKGCFYEAL